MTVADRNDQRTYQATPEQRAERNRLELAVADQLATVRPDDLVTENQVIDIVHDLTPEPGPVRSLLLAALPIAYGMTRTHYADELREMAGAA